MKRAHGFSLLEVMVAVALLSLGLVMLLQVQARSIQLAQDARYMTVATMLARGKMYDCQADMTKRGFSTGDYDEEGSFDDDGFPSFYWECHAYKPELPVPGATDITAGASEAAAAGADPAAAAAGGAAEMGMGFLAPILSQISGVMGDSIRELVVVVRWQDGEAWDELRVATHVIDKTAVNNIAAMLRQSGGGIPGMPGLPGASGGSTPGGGPGLTPPAPGGRGGAGGAGGGGGKP